MLLFACAAAACGSGPIANAQDVRDAQDTGRKLPAQTPTEKAILQQLGQLSAGARTQLANGTVVAEPAYHAASGRICRALRITEPGQQKVRQRLACSEDGEWFFVPDVLGLEQPRQ